MVGIVPDLTRVYFVDKDYKTCDDSSKMCDFLVRLY